MHARFSAYSSTIAPGAISPRDIGEIDEEIAGTRFSSLRAKDVAIIHEVVLIPWQPPSRRLVKRLCASKQLPISQWS
ncbi:hypothetical protein KPH14_005249 [Odynerus spinipes]|uniref:Uncharacterized protein n=1 Tax=Odynerus spinipes TaxID=1348599 RepID=A0AAD9RBI0_9HYME|nr:hypothetical protein KPH14_005249 [Odynerus spinipes]